MLSRPMVSVMWPSIAWIMTSAVGVVSHAAEPREILVRRTPNNTVYGIIGDVANLKAPAPTLFVFAHGIDEMKRQPIYTEVSAILALRGWISVIVEPPCHGEDARTGEPPQLKGWRHRLDADENFLEPFHSKTKAILDQLIKENITDPNRVAACGTSRGGFLAYHFAAFEPRVKAVGGISPVTRLIALSEFASTMPIEKADRLDVANLAPKLAGRSVWLSIGNHDARVDTDAAIAFTRAVVRASAKPEAPNDAIPVNLLVCSANGHSKIDQAHEILAEWLMERVPSAKGAKPQ